MNEARLVLAGGRDEGTGLLADMHRLRDHARVDRQAHAMPQLFALRKKVAR